MANFNNITIGQNVSVNGLTVSVPTTTATNVPNGSITLGESILVNTGAYQQVYLSSSANPTIATITVVGSLPSGSGSVALVASGSGFASNLGSISGSQASVISWNQPLYALYAEAFTTASFVNFIIVTQ